MDYVKNSILTLFDDNVAGSITAEDMRIFVDAVFDAKENNIHVFEKLSELVVYRQTDGLKYPIVKFDLIVITDQNNQNQITERGIYIALQDNPDENSVFKVSNVNYDEFLALGETGQLVSLDADKKLTWINPIEGYFIEGTAPITEILMKRPNQKGPVWIAEADDFTAPIPGYEGDGYSWTGSEWVNIGQLRGPQGDVVDLVMATQQEVDAGYSDSKAVSPMTLKNTTLWNKKEDSLGNPQIDGSMLISTQGGQRSWKVPVNSFGDLNDVDLTGLLDNSFVYFNGINWTHALMSDYATKKFTELDDTPSTFAGAGGLAVTVNQSETALEYSSLVKTLNQLDDVSNAQPNNGEIMKYNGIEWVFVPDTSSVASGSTIQRPINVPIGYMYFDQTIGQPIWFNGVTWVTSDGDEA